MAESEEMKSDRQYLNTTAERLRAGGVTVDTLLALGDPPAEILKTAIKEGCDLIAMTTHGHRLLGDIVFGSTIEHVRHASKIPLLIVHANA
jgi:manganese transport protein